GREKRAQVKIKGVDMQPVFPILRKFYDDNPLGSIIIRNGEQGSISDVKVSLFARQYMDAPKQSAVLAQMKQNEEKEVPLYALFTDNILGITEATKAQAEITVEYTFNKTSLVVKQVETMRILDRNAMTWDDDRKTVAFV